MSQSELNRREFLASAAVVGACVACGACAMSGAEAVAADAPAGVDIGAVADYAKEGVVEKFARRGRFLVVTRNGKIYALSNACTHKRVAIKVDGELIKCPEHGSAFALDGSVSNGPATLALPRFGIKLTDGKLSVDPSVKFVTEKDWDKDGAFVAVPVTK